MHVHRCDRPLLTERAKDQCREVRRHGVPGSSHLDPSARSLVVVKWLDAREQQRREARERRFLQKVEQKNLEAQGLTANEAKRKAEQVAGFVKETFGYVEGLLRRGYTVLCA